MELMWRKSSHSDNLGGNCVEVASLPEGVGVRDSKDPDAACFVLDVRRFRALVAEIKGR